MKTLSSNEPFVDVILPNYNKSKFIKDAINSVTAQTYSNWHLYIIDDNSTDSSVEIINKFSSLTNVTVVKLHKNKGPAFCRNYGMRISQSKYIAFIDSDNTTTMIITRSILGNHKFKKIRMHEDYLFKCEILKNNNMAHKLNDITAFYRILDRSRSRKRLKSIYWLWYVNKNFNKLQFIKNIISIFFITINSIRKYGRIK